MKKSQIKSELEKVRDKSPDKLLHAELVVKAASKVNHPLHGLFTWDDKKAGAQYRLFQARSLIRSVRISDPEDALRPTAPAYVALRSDKPIGGYRRTQDIISSDELSDALRETALSELRGWVKRFRTLSDLVGGVAEAAGLELPLEAGA